MVQKLSNSFVWVFGILSFSCLSQEDAKPNKSADYKSDSSYAYFSAYRVKVANAQINLLKNEGALLVRLKTNSNTISKLKAAGNIDLATHVERETYTINKTIVRAFTKEFKFCPVYFFYSTYSDSVKHKHLQNILLDTNLLLNPSIVCNANFYLIAEQGSIYDSSLGLVSENQADKAIERGVEIKSASIVVKNRYFIQLHKPFPYFQKGTNVKLKDYLGYVKAFNEKLHSFYQKNAGTEITPDIKEFVY